MAHKNKLPQKPRISPNLESSALLDKPFSDHEEYGSLQLEHDAIHDVDADLVIIENSTFSKIDFKNCTLHKPRITNVIFDGCDFVCCGDIHLYQVMNYHGTPIVQPSSMVQQDFGESVDNHGYVVWNVETKEHKHINLESDYGFYTFKINSITDIEEEMEKLV